VSVAVTQHSTQCQAQNALVAHREYSSILSFSAKKEVTFVYQKLLLFLSIAKAMAYHHALACISSPQAYIINRRLHRFRNDGIQNCVLMIYRNKLRM
jgi:hypothetical protein